MITPLPEHAYSIYGMPVLSPAPLHAALPHASLGGAPRVLVREHVSAREHWPLRAIALEAARHSPALWLGSDELGHVLEIRHRLLEAVFHLDPSGQDLDVHVAHAGALPNARALLLHPVLLYAASLRGCIHLHANVMALGDQAIALVGASGAGKSTLSAALWRRGWRVIADDNAALVHGGAGALVHHGVACLKLGRQELAGLGLDPLEQRPQFDGPLGECEAKYLLGPARRVAEPEQPVPLLAIYCLGPRGPGLARPCIGPLAPARALPLLALSTRGGELRDRAGAIDEFQTLFRIARDTPVRSLVAPDSRALLDTVCEAVEEDVGSL